MINPNYTPEPGDLLTTATHWVEVHEIGYVYYASGKIGEHGRLYRKPYGEFVREARGKAEILERSRDEGAVSIRS